MSALQFVKIKIALATVCYNVLKCKECKTPVSLRPSNATYFLSLLDTYCGSHLITTSAWQLEGVPSFHPDAMLVLGSIWFYEANPAFGIANTLVQEMNTNIWYDLKHISPHCPEHLRRETPDEQRWKDLPWHSAGPESKRLQWDSKG